MDEFAEDLDAPRLPAVVEAYIDEDLHILLQKLRNEVAGGLAFVSDAHHGPRSGGMR